MVRSSTLLTTSFTLEVWVDFFSSGSTGGGSDIPSSVLKSLEERQEAILAKLGHLRFVRISCSPFFTIQKNMNIR